MKLLLDTHAFIWWDSEPSRLSPRALALCQNPENLLIVSVVSIWEMQIKLQLGKLKLQLPLKDTIANQQKTNQVAILPTILPHVLALSDLPVHHGDPFDRLWHEHLVERKVTYMLDLQDNSSSLRMCLRG
jgi:PIN domain nuclease of toxin-antitoxin system